jgi:type I site-specific restriction endonuclease
LRQGIEDGFLAPYRVHRIVTEWDAAGWRPSKDDLDRYGREIPDSEYQTVDFERAVALKARTEAIARNITHVLKKTDRFAKTIVFCVDQEHADEMRRSLNNLNDDLSKQYPDYVCRVTSEKVRTLYPSAADLRKQWADPALRAEIIAKLEERGIDFDQLRATSNQPEADPFDLLCHLAFNGPLRTRRERADRVKKEEKSFFEKHGPEARAILADLLEKYAEHGTTQFIIPDVLKVPPISQRGNVREIAKLFGGPEELREAVADLQALLYAA